MLALKVNPALCDGCGRCTAACSLGRAFSAGAIEQYLDRKMGAETAPLPTPLLRINRQEGGWRIHLCRHCETPVCADACVAGAIYIDGDSGTVQVSAAKCVGCWSCVMECPFQALRLADAVAVKCDGCRGRASPLCARVCPRGALRSAGDGSSAAARRRRERVVKAGRVNKGWVAGNKP